MNLFQIVAIGGLLLVLLWEVTCLFRYGLARNWTRWLRMSIFIAAIVAIARPDFTTLIAHVFGIERGADLVLYLFSLAFLMTSFFLYAQCVHTQRQVTQLTRHLAIRDARRGSETSA